MRGLAGRRTAAGIPAGVTLASVLLALGPGTLLAAAAGDPTAGPGLSLRATPDRTRVSVGDRVVVTYEARLPRGSTLAVSSLVTPAPGEGAPAGAAPVLEYEEPAPAETEADGDGVRWTLRVALIPFLAGTTSVPGPELTYTAPSGESSSVKPPPVTLEVGSRLPPIASPAPEETAPGTAAAAGAAPAAPEPEPKPDRPFRIPAHGAWFWASLALATLGLAAVIAWLIRRRRKRPAPFATAAPELPADEELGKALDLLAGRADQLGDDPRPFYSELTHVTKRYLERRLGMPVLEWTTFETLRKLRDAGWEVPREVGLPELLGSADRVKFGRGAATAGEARRHVENARHLLAHVEARLSTSRPAPAAEATR